MRTLGSGLLTLALSIGVPAAVSGPVAGQSPSSAELSLTPQRTGFRMVSDGAEGWEGIWGVAVGVGATWRLSDRVRLHVGLDYSRFGANETGGIDGSESRVRWAHFLTAALIQTSVPVGREADVVLSAGPALLLARNCRYWSSEQEPYSTLPGGTWSSCADTRRQPPGLSPGVPFISPRQTQKGVVVRLEVWMPLSESLWFAGGVRGDWGLEGVDRLDMPGDWRRQTIGASVGVSLSLGG